MLRACELIDDDVLGELVLLVLLVLLVPLGASWNIYSTERTVELRARDCSAGSPATPCVCVTDDHHDFDHPVSKNFDGFPLKDSFGTRLGHFDARGSG